MADLYLCPEPGCEHALDGKGVHGHFRDGGLCKFYRESGGRVFTVTAQRKIEEPDPSYVTGIAREPSVSWVAVGPVSPRQADDFADLVQHAAQIARS